MSDELKAIEARFVEASSLAATVAELEQVRVEALGKKGAVTLRMKSLGGLDPEARKAAGQTLNEVKEAIAAAIESRRRDLEEDPRPLEGG